MLLASIHLYAAGYPPLAAPAVGQSAPDFALRPLQDKNVRLSEHLGEVVILNFWASWCGPCRQEMPLLNELHVKYRRAGLVLLSVNLDDEPERAAEDARCVVPVLLDGGKEAAKAFAIGNLPVTVLIDRAGDVRYVSDGYKPGYEARYTERLRELLNE